MNVGCWRCGDLQALESMLDNSAGEGKWDVNIAEMYSKEWEGCKVGDWVPKPSSDATVLVLGNEGNGISEELKKRLLEGDERYRSITVPMENNVESLNVGVAGAVCMYEIKSKMKP